MNSVVSRVTRLIIAVALIVGLFPAVAFGTHTPDPSTDCSTIVGEYTYASNEGVGIHRNDVFAYNDEWFMGPSSTFNAHLATLSALTSMASASRYLAVDERDSSQNSKHIEALLTDLGFENVVPNTYYNQDKLPYGAGVALGHKTIVENDKKYTLLAIVPRSAGYKQEWAGNFTVGTGGLHEGFKAGCDEILRFVKQYVADSNITGDVKVWTCGHSRGAALANTVGAFFAAGGASDYINNISITPENVYTYTFATPTTLLNGRATKGELLSVSGAQSHSSDARYAWDSPGAAHTYTGADAANVLDPQGSEFAGVYHVTPGFDIIVLLPPPQWGYTWFGTNIELKDIDGDGQEVSKEAMLTELAALDSVAKHAYNLYVNGGDEGDYHYMRFDLDSLEFVQDDSYGSITQAESFYARIDGLSTLATDVDTYVSGNYQEALAALAGIYGMNEPVIGDVISGVVEKETATVVKAALFAYLAYASERLQAEGRASDDIEAVTLVLEEAIEYITGTVVNPETFTVDNLLYIFAKYLVDNADITFSNEGGVPPQKVVSVEYHSKTAEAVFNAISDAVVNAIPEEYKSFIDWFISGYSSMTPEEQKEAAGKFVLGFMNACAYGDGTPDTPGSGDEDQSPETYRRILYGMFGLFFGDYEDIITAISEDGSHPATELLAAVLPLLMPEGASSIDEAADATVTDFFTKAMDAFLATGRFDEGTPFYNDLAGHGETIKERVTELRRIVLYLLLYKEGVPFSVKDNIYTASTFVSQAITKVSSAHYNENYVAWMRAQDSAYPAHLHQLEQIAAQDPTCTEAGHSEYWQCSVCGLYFADEHAATEIDLDDVAIQAHGHKWGPWTVVKEASVTEEGLEERVCEHDPSHKETRPIPKLPEEEKQKASPSAQTKKAPSTGDAIGAGSIAVLVGAALIALLCMVAAAKLRRRRRN